MVTITLHDGQLLDIHDSAWAKFFDGHVLVQPHPAPDDLSHGKLTLSFSIPGTPAIGKMPLTPSDGAMTFESNYGRLSLR